MRRFALAASALLLLLTAMPAMAAPAPSVPGCVRASGAGVFSAAWACPLDRDADGAPDGVRYGAFAGAVVPVVLVAGFAFAGTDGEVADQSGDGVPESAALRPAWWAVGYATITPCSEPPHLLMCWTLHCLACDEAAVRLEDVDRDGLPDAVSYSAPGEPASPGAIELPWP
jgi:hypothetical protein